MKTIQTVKVNVLIQEMEEKANAIWAGKKFTDNSDVHNTVQEVAVEVFKKHDLKGFIFTVWHIKIDALWENVFQYELDCTFDKRYKWEQRGIVNKVTFTPSMEIKEDDTFEDLIRMIEKKRIEDSISNVEKYTAEAKETYEKGTQDLIDLREKLKSYQ
jgi:hypothetical protein